MKYLNTSVIKCLENCSKETLLNVLFAMLNNYKVNVRMQHTIVNCLMKMMDGIQVAISFMKIDQLLMKMHLYLITINPKNLTKQEENGMRVV